jgi:hypothetical protein
MWITHAAEPQISGMWMKAEVRPLAGVNYWAYILMYVFTMTMERRVLGNLKSQLFT